MPAESKRKRLKSMTTTATTTAKKIPKSYYIFGFMCFSLIFLTYKFQLIGIFGSDSGTTTLTEFGSIFNSGAYDIFCDRKWLNSSRPCLCYADFLSSSNASEVDMTSLKCAMTFEPVGRLGNIIGQYVGLWVLSRFNDRPVFMTPEMGETLDKYFHHLSIPTIDRQVYARNQWTDVALNYVMEPSYKNISGLFLKLHGYPYSKTYFQDFVEDIRKEFRLKSEYHTIAQNTLHKIKNSRILSPAKFLKSSDPNSRMSSSSKPDLKSSDSSSSKPDLKSSYSSSSKPDLKSSDSSSSKPDLNWVTFVGVHVRRGDYIRMFNSAHRGVLADRKYFMQAMSYFRERFLDPVFVIVSNDMKWCEKNIPNDSHDVYFAGTGNENDPITDFALLVNCNHTIYTFGTYGFFAALFAGGDVVYFTNFTDNNFKNDSFYHYDTPLPQWHPIAATDLTTTTTIN